MNAKTPADVVRDESYYRSHPGNATSEANLAREFRKLGREYGIESERFASAGAALIAQYGEALLANAANKWGISFGRDGKPLSRDVCHILLKRAEKDYAKLEARTKHLVEALEVARANMRPLSACSFISSDKYSDACDRWMEAARQIDEALAQAKAHARNDNALPTESEAA